MCRDPISDPLAPLQSLRNYKMTNKINVTCVLISTRLLDCKNTQSWSHPTWFSMSKLVNFNMIILSSGTIIFQIHKLDRVRWRTYNKWQSQVWQIRSIALALAHNSPITTFYRILTDKKQWKFLMLRIICLCLNFWHLSNEQRSVNYRMARNQL